MGRHGRQKKKRQYEGIDCLSLGLESEGALASSSVDASMGLENGGWGASASSSVDTESNISVKAVANKADVEIERDGPKDNEAKYEKMQGSCRRQIE